MVDWIPSRLRENSSEVQGPVLLEVPNRVKYEENACKRRILVTPPHQGSGAGIAIKWDAWVSG